MDKNYEEFKYPPAPFRSRPFWAWNGRLKGKELIRQIHIFKEMGFGGFFMHSRTGLETKYLGREWFDLISSCTREGKRLGLQPWLYDEDRWPSGSAGGIVTRNPRYRRKILTLTIEEFNDVSESVIAVFIGRVDGINLKPGWRLKSKDTVIQDGEKYLIFREHIMCEKNEYNGCTDVDRLNLEATKRFLSVTHMKYASMCEGEFEDIKGVFTDEPHRGMVFSDFSDSGDDKKWSLPWTDDLPEEFSMMYGSDLIRQLPALFLQPNNKKIVKVKWQYMELLQRLFIKRFLEPIKNWANENGKLTTGHFLHEDSLISQAIPCGSMMRCYPYLDEPGVDNLTENNFAPWAVKALESVARQFCLKWKLSELFGATGWQMSFKDFKYVGDWQTILGINVRCPHISWYTMKGEAKRDYPGSFLHQATWYKEYNVLETYFSRLSVVASSGDPVCDTLVLHPVESLWCMIHPGWAEGLEALDPTIKKIDRQFVNLFEWLMESQIDFDYGDEGILKEKGIVKPGGRLCIGGMCYSRVVISGCLNIRESTLSLLREFDHAGGNLVFIGKPPLYVSCERSDECLLLARKNVQIEMRRQNVFEYFNRLDVPIHIIDTSVLKDFYMQIRRTPTGRFVIFWNKSKKKSYKNIAVKVPSDVFVQIWDCLNGNRYLLPVNDHRVYLDFSPGQEIVLYITKNKEVLGMYQLPFSGKAIKLKEISDFSLDEPNVFVLDVADLWIDDELIAEKTEILKLDCILRRKLGIEARSGEMIQPWARKNRINEKKSRIRLRYNIPVEMCPGEQIFIALEELPGMLFFFNGEEISIKKENRFWIDDCFSIYAIPADIWREGENILEIEADYSEKCGLEAMFLLGEFGVWFRNEKPVLGELPNNLKIGNLVYQGFPFYSGKVTYKFRITQNCPFSIKLGDIGGSCAVAMYNGEKQYIPWNSYMPIWKKAVIGEKLDLQVVLTRRNTFGPLHKFPIKQPFISPNSFECDNPEKYSLYPSGLLSAPEIIVNNC